MKRGHHRSNPDDSVFGEMLNGSGAPLDSGDDGLMQRPVDRMVHEVLDAEARGDQAAARAWFRAAVAVDPAAVQRLRELRRVLTQARKAPPAPDLSAAILASVDAQQPFVTRRRRRQISATRVAVAASFVVTGVLIALVHSSGTPVAAPSGRFAEANGRDDGALSRDGLEPVIAPRADRPRLTMQTMLPPPAPALGSPPRLTLGDTSRYAPDAGWIAPTTIVAENLFLAAARDDGPLAEFSPRALGERRHIELLGPVGLTLMPSDPAATVVPASPLDGLLGLPRPGSLLYRVPLEWRLQPDEGSQRR